MLYYIVYVYDLFINLFKYYIFIKEMVVLYIFYWINRLLFWKWFIVLNFFILFVKLVINWIGNNFYILKNFNVLYDLIKCILFYRMVIGFDYF